MAVRERIPDLRRERKVNYGSAQSVQGAARATLINMSTEHSAPLLVTVNVDELAIPGNALGTGDFRPYIHLAWGHGAIDVEADFEVTARTRIPLVASTVRGEVFIRSLPLSTSAGYLVAPVPAGAAAQFRAFVADGLDAEPLYPTIWIDEMGTNAGLLVGPANVGTLVGQQVRVGTFRGFAITTGNAALAGFLQLFDQATVPVNGNVPVDVMPIVVEPVASLTQEPTGARGFPLGQTRAFTQGLGWAISSTPFTLTLIATAQAFVTAEIQLPFP